MESNKNIIYIGVGILAVVVIIFMMLPASVVKPLLYVLLFLGSIFLILLVLIQRGRGGGLAGALGGMGGYSAFGTRAGDIFTRITIVAAAIWLLAAMALAKINLVGGQSLFDPAGAATKSGSSSGGAGASDSSKEGDTSEPSPAASEGTQPFDKTSGAPSDSQSQ